MDTEKRRLGITPKTAPFHPASERTADQEIDVRLNYEQLNTAKARRTGMVRLALLWWT